MCITIYKNDRKSQNKCKFCNNYVCNEHSEKETKYVCMNCNEDD